METRKDYLTASLECYHKGAFTIYTVAEALEQMKRCDLYWVCRLDRYGWKIQDYQDESPVCRKTGRRAMKFGFKIHTRARPYTLEDAQNDFNNGRIIDDYGTFISWGAKFNSLFKEDKEETQAPVDKKRRRKLLLPRQYWPFVYTTLPAGSVCTWPAYELNPNLNILVIVKAVKSPHGTPDIPWEVFSMSPHQGDDAGAIGASLPRPS